MFAQINYWCVDCICRLDNTGQRYRGQDEGYSGRDGGGGSMLSMLGDDGYVDANVAANEQQVCSFPPFCLWRVMVISY